MMVDLPATHRAARSELGHQLGDALRQLRRQRPTARLCEFCIALGLWLAGSWLGLAGLPAVDATWATWLSKILGVFLAFGGLNMLMLLSHEGHHGLLARSRRGNALVSWLVCLPLLHAPTAYRVLHTLHHRHLGGPGDPDEYSNYATGGRVWLLHWMRLTVGPVLYLLLIPGVAIRRVPAARWRIIVEYALMVPLWVAAFMLIPPAGLLQAWIVPALMVGIMCSIRGLTQHTLTDPSNAIRASRSVDVGPVLATVLLNENLHLAHHLFPEVPSYNLHRLDRRLRYLTPEAPRCRGYARFLLSFARARPVEATP